MGEASAPGVKGQGMAGRGRAGLGALSILIGVLAAGSVASAQPSPRTAEVVPEPAQPATVSPSPVEPLPAPTSDSTVEVSAEPLESDPASDLGEDATALEEQATALDMILREAARDLNLPLAYQHPAVAGPVDEQRLLDGANNGYALGAQLLPVGQKWVVRLSLVAPGSETILVGRALVSEGTLEVRAIRLLRDLARHSSPAPVPPAPVRAVVRPKRSEEHRSPGRAILTAHGAAVGGYVGFSLEHIGGAGDARLVFPLMTLGAGAGVGASLVVAEEWDVSVAEAWYIWASGAWSAGSGMLIADGQPDATDSQRYGYGLLGVASGLTLGSVALSSGEVSTGGAVFTHSGAIFGALLGGLGQMLVVGDTDISPTLGVGVGMGSGLLVAGGIAPVFGRVSSSRVLFVDVSAMLGGLAGAALASPLLVGEELSPQENRLWLGSIAAGAVAGAVVGVVLTRDKPQPAGVNITPFFDVVQTPEGRRAHVVGFAGEW